ncbi:hypothetical protein KEJ37_05480 [Candidatus Bathyarchaeota archaeon]|nr:hypothetical protein [Candidatus Bathyarchaeota archaeon]
MSHVTAIRGLDKELYQRIYTLAKQNGKRVSDIINEALKNYLQSHDDPVNPNQQNPVIENAGTLTLTKGVILNLHQELQKEFIIRNDGKLLIDQDVTRETLQHIKSIVNTSSGVIKAPKHIYHLIILRSKNYGSLEMY